MSTASKTKPARLGGEFLVRLHQCALDESIQDVFFQKDTNRLNEGRPLIAFHQDSLLKLLGISIGGLRDYMGRQRFAHSSDEFINGRRMRIFRTPPCFTPGRPSVDLKVKDIKTPWTAAFDPLADPRPQRGAPVIAGPRTRPLQLVPVTSAAPVVEPRPATPHLHMHPHMLSHITTVFEAESAYDEETRKMKVYMRVVIRTAREDGKMDQAAADELKAASERLVHIALRWSRIVRSEKRRAAKAPSSAKRRRADRTSDESAEGDGGARRTVRRRQTTPKDDGPPPAATAAFTAEEPVYRVSEVSAIVGLQRLRGGMPGAGGDRAVLDFLHSASSAQLPYGPLDRRTINVYAPDRVDPISADSRIINDVCVVSRGSTASVESDCSDDSDDGMRSAGEEGADSVVDGDSVSDSDSSAASDGGQTASDGSASLVFPVRLFAAAKRQQGCRFLKDLEFGVEVLEVFDKDAALVSVPGAGRNAADRSIMLRNKRDAFGKNMKYWHFRRLGQTENGEAYFRPDYHSACDPALVRGGFADDPSYPPPFCYDAGH
ncbi:hypothetical protein JKP88DRAFT_273097 [Tribonema minus]|uniref:Uncharacterized protein n=1 Tax=Tribonema minus TaxID=303371 RepID=A0A835YXA8_9STRA|nr:hypothetical protein JKP88DRAFT_273097 [Tribonema minus]